MNCNEEESNEGSPKGSLNKETAFPKKEKIPRPVFIHINEQTCITGILKFNPASLFWVNGNDSMKVRQTSPISDDYWGRQ